MVKQKSFTYQYVCDRCGIAFFRAKLRGGKQFYCDRCGPLVASEKHAQRQATYRARRKAQTTPEDQTASEDGSLRISDHNTTEQSGDKSIWPVAGGGDHRPAKPVVRPAKGGMYAGLPEPEQTARRVRVGLPVAGVTPMTITMGVTKPRHEENNGRND